MTGLGLTTAFLLISPPTAISAVALEPTAFVVPSEGQQAALPVAAPLPMSAEMRPAAIEPPAPPQTPAPKAPAEGGEIVVTGRRHDPGDPFQNINAESFQVTQAIDTALVRPVAKAYERVLPPPARDGIRNFLNNLREPVSALNFLLQHKVGKTARTLARFAVNSTIGIGGLLDVAKRKPFKLDRRRNSFANTLGFYGVKTGVFMYLPIIGPTTLRDLIGTTLDRFVLPFAVGSPFNNPAVTIPAGVLGTIDHRAQFDETLEQLHHETPDSYVASREFYLAQRQAEIDELHGKGHREVRPNPGSIKPQTGAPIDRK